MKYLTSIFTLLALIFCVLAPSHADAETAPLRHGLEGFTPNPSVSIALRDPHFLVGLHPTASATVTIDGPQRPNAAPFDVHITGPADTDITISLTLGGSPGSNSKTVAVNLPSEVGVATYHASATIDDEAVYDDDDTTGYTWNISFVESEVAAGNIDDPAHRATFEMTAWNGKNGVPDIEALLPEVTVGGRGSSDAKTAKVRLAEGASVTDANGKVKGVFVSGNRTETTTIAHKVNGNAINGASIEQKWNQLSPQEAFSFDPYFDYNTNSPIYYTMSYGRGAITGHSMQFENYSLTGWEKVPSSYDWDGDGILEDAYWFNAYTAEDEDLSKWNAYDSISAWGTVEEDEPGIYKSNQVVSRNEGFLVQSMEFDIVDKSSYDKNGG